MSELKDLVSLQLFFAFVVPGVVATYVRAQFLTGRIPSVKENVFEIIILSSVYYAIIIVFIQPVLEMSGPRLYRDAAWISLTLIGPAIFGIALGAAGQRHIFARLANWMNLSVVNVIPTAWDWHFLRLRSGCFVMITMTDRSRVFGYFGTNSYASSDDGERDIYLEEEWDWTDEEGWKQRSENVGILIPAREIKFIEFWN